MNAAGVLDELGLDGAAYAAPVQGGRGLGFNQNAPVAPASVMKVQVALATETLIARGELDGRMRVQLRHDGRTPGPVGISLMRDDVEMSVRDLVVAMLTISDNAATDELIAVVGLDEVNRIVSELGLGHTVITADLRQTLDAVARDAGFRDYQALVAHQPSSDGRPSDAEIRQAISGAQALDPRHGTRTTAFETVTLLQALWTDQFPPQACQNIRSAMSKQLVKTRIASGFDGSVSVAAKSGGLLGVVRNEAGVVTYADGHSYAVAVFTRKGPENATDPVEIDQAIGRIARILVDQLRNPTKSTGEPD